MNLTKHLGYITKEHRKALNKHGAKVLWLTGLSGAGKSTIARDIEVKLHGLGVRSYVLDGDNLRLGINSDLSFSPLDRSENIRRTAEVAKILIDSGCFAIVALISPYQRDRELAKEIIGHDNIVEIFISTPIKTCEERDVKGLYKRARNGLITEFTGITSPYEPPHSPDLTIDTRLTTADKASNIIIESIRSSIIL